MTQSLNDKLAAFFLERPGEWIDGKMLAAIAGGYAWRSRVSDLRTKHGLTIENRQRRSFYGRGVRYVTSEYRYVPAVGQQELSL
jgi:hypothetical protein